MCIPTQGAIVAGMWALEAVLFKNTSVNWAVQSPEDMDGKGTFILLRKATASLWGTGIFGCPELDTQ